MLVWGIGSGVASAAFVIAKALGARTLVTSSSEEKLARAPSSARTRRSTTRRTTSPQPSRRRPAGGASTSSSSTSARPRGRPRFSPPHPCSAWSSAGRRAARTRRRSSTASGGSSSPLRLDDGNEEGLRGRLRVGRQWRRSADRRPRLPARAGGCGPRVPRGRPAVREGRPPDPGLGARALAPLGRRAEPGGSGPHPESLAALGRRFAREASERARDSTSRYGEGPRAQHPAASVARPGFCPADQRR